MVRIPDGDDADAGGFRLFHRELHRLVADELAHCVVRVDDRADRRLKDDLRLRVDLDHAVFDAFVVAHHALHAVGFNAVEVGGQEHVLDDVRFRLREAELLKCVHAQAVQSVVTPILICH